MFYMVIDVLDFVFISTQGEATIVATVLERFSSLGCAFFVSPGFRNDSKYSYSY